MAYETGVATSPSDLLTKIGVFAQTQGWTPHTGGAGGDSPGQVSLDDGAGFVMNAIADVANKRISFQPSTAYVGAGTSFFNHTGSPSTAGTGTTFGQFSLDTGPFVAYHLFANTSAPRYVHCVVEITNGIFSHFHFGVCVKFSTYTGGGYAASLAWGTSTGNSHTPFNRASNQTPASLPAEWIRADGIFGASTPTWHRDIGEVCLSAGAGGTEDSFTHHLYRGGTSLRFGRSTLAPNYLKAQTTDGSTVVANMLLGYTPDIRLVSMFGLNAGQEITIGSDVWKCFPARAKALDLTSALAYVMNFTGSNHSGLQGYAFRKF